MTSVLVGDEWPASRSCSFTTGEKAPDNSCIGGWVGPRVGLYNMEYFTGTRTTTPSRPTRSQSL
jgi:hypothetical protein